MESLDCYSVSRIQEACWDKDDSCLLNTSCLYKLLCQWLPPQERGWSVPTMNLHNAFPAIDKTLISATGKRSEIKSSNNYNKTM